MVRIINKYKKQITFASGILILLGYILGLFKYTNVKNIFLILATILASTPIFINAYQALIMKLFSIELLVSIAVLGALYIQEYTESAVVTFLFLLGSYLEARTLEKTRSSLKKLLDMAPKKATIIKNDSLITVTVDQVVKGDRVAIRSGEQVAVDGLVVSGQAFINEATITGESVPVSKKVGDSVFSGTIIDNGYIEIITEKVGKDTTFAKIIALVEEAQESKTKTVKFLDKFATIYTPSIVVLSVLVLLITKNIHMSITFLVVACPGALVIGAPVSSVAGIGNGAKKGVLIKGGEVIDRLSKVDILIFDKTGTLTKGKPEVTDIKIFEKKYEKEMLRLVATLETISEHHLGYTIVKYAKGKKIDLSSKITDYKVIKGKGITGKIEKYKIVVGNSKLMKEQKISIPKEIMDYTIYQEKRGNTVIQVAINKKLVGLISITDQIREDALFALNTMREHGVKKIVMLTGDNENTAKLVSEQLNIDEFYSSLLPEDKVKHIKDYKKQGYVVAYAGDGINDAPAIAVADIGLAMGKGGTDVSMETADIVLLADKLTQLSHAYSLSKATVKNVKQNIFLAISVVILLLLGVLFNWVHLAVGMFVHEGSVLIVILNSMRLLKYDMNKEKKA